MPYGSGGRPMDILHGDCVVDIRSSVFPAIVVGTHNATAPVVDRAVHKMSAHTRVHYAKHGIFWPKHRVWLKFTAIEDKPHALRLIHEGIKQCGATIPDRLFQGVIGHWSIEPGLSVNPVQKFLVIVGETVGCPR